AGAGVGAHMQILGHVPTNMREGEGEPVHVADPGERLAGPDGFAVKKEILARLDSLMQQVNARLRSGLGRDGYGDAEVLKVAIRAAHRFAETYPAQAPKLF